jgi:hypothetical protein
MKIAVFWVVIALMMEAARTSETLVNFYQTTRCYNPEDSNLQYNFWLLRGFYTTVTLLARTRNVIDIIQWKQVVNKRKLICKCLAGKSVHIMSQPFYCEPRRKYLHRGQASIFKVGNERNSPAPCDCNSLASLRKQYHSATRNWEVIALRPADHPPIPQTICHTLWHAIIQSLVISISDSWSRKRSTSDSHFIIICWNVYNGNNLGIFHSYLSVCVCVRVSILRAKHKPVRGWLSEIQLAQSIILSIETRIALKPPSTGCFSQIIPKPAEEISCT